MSSSFSQIQFFYSFNEKDGNILYIYDFETLTLMIILKFASNYVKNHIKDKLDVIKIYILVTY